jgi:hypothetical protein
VATAPRDQSGDATAPRHQPGDATAPRHLERPAFYALAAGGWRDLVTLLHPPYTAWHLSYVALGAVAAPRVHAIRLVAALGAFFLAVGVSAHAFDELNGRPLMTRLPRWSLVALAVAGLAGAVAIGVVGAVVVSPLLVPLVAFGALLVPVYNLELARGRFHNDAWFALAWGGFPAFTGYFANSLTVRPAGLLVTAACCLLSVAQRRLSTPARELRRRTVAVEGEQRLADGRVIQLDRQRLASPLEGTLSALWIALVLLAVGLVAVRL